MLETKNTIDDSGGEADQGGYFSVETVSEAPFAMPDIEELSTEKSAVVGGDTKKTFPNKKSSNLKFILIYASVAIMFVVALGIILTENGFLSLGFENIYNKISLEKRWGGLSTSPRDAVSRSFIAMSKQSDYEVSGSFDLVVENSTQSKILSPLLINFGQTILSEDVSMGPSIKAFLTSSTDATVSLSSDVTEVDSGGSAVITWESTNTTKCLPSWDDAFVGTSGQVTISNIVYNRSFEMTCVNGDDALFDYTVPYGENKVKSSYLLVTVKGDPAAPTPTTTLSADPAVILSGGSTKLTWSSTDTTGCSASWTSKTAVAGFETISNITVGTAYTIVCTGSGGSSTRTATVIVNTSGSADQPATSPAGSATSTTTTLYPTVSLSANDTYVDYGGSAILTWGSKNASTCSATWTKKTSQSGSETITNITSEKTYTMVCKSSSGNTSTNSVKILVAPASKYSTSSSGTTAVNSQAPTVVLQASSGAALPGDTVTLTWKAENANNCSAAWTTKTATSGTEIVLPANSGNYYIYCFSGLKKIKSNEITISITGSVVMPPVSRQNLLISSTFKGLTTKNGTHIDFTLLDNSGNDSILAIKDSPGFLWMRSDRAQFDEKIDLDKWLKFPFSSKDNMKYLDQIFVPSTTKFQFATGTKVGNEKCDTTRCYHYDLASIDVPTLADRLGIQASTINNATGEIWIGIGDKLVRKISLNIFFVGTEESKQAKIVINFSKYGTKNSFAPPSAGEYVESSF